MPGDTSDLVGASDLRHSFTLTFYRKKRYLILTYPTSAIAMWDLETGSKLFPLAMS